MVRTVEVVTIVGVVVLFSDGMDGEIGEVVLLGRGDLLVEHVIIVADEIVVMAAVSVSVAVAVTVTSVAVIVVIVAVTVTIVGGE